MQEPINVKLNCESIGEINADREGVITIELNKVGHLLYSFEFLEKIIPNVEPKAIIAIISSNYSDELLEEDYMLEFASKILRVHDKFIDIRDENAR